MTRSDDTRVASATVSLDGDGWQLRCRVSVPAGPIRLGELLPVARGLSEASVAAALEAVGRAGGALSCRAGCGACCRNMVAISEVEARRILEVIASMPEERRARVVARFEDARARLERADLLTALERPEELTGAEYSDLAARYFAQRIACPFLEDESCSIYEERPLTCREYVVVSPPEHCSHPETGEVRRVRLPATVFNAVARCQTAPSAHVEERWIPLVLAPAWAEAHPDEAPPRPGIELLRELLGHLAPPPVDSAGT